MIRVRLFCLLTMGLMVGGAWLTNEPTHSAPSIRSAANSDLDPTPLAVSSKVVSEERRRILVEGGLLSLSKSQNADGSIGGKNAQSSRIAVTSLALLAFLADGNSESRGAFCAQVRSAIAFLCRCSLKSGPRRGYFEANGDTVSRMHGHGYATLALCQAYGQYGAGRKFVGTSADLRQVIANAVDLIVRSQNSAGGWYYQPLDSVDDEGSITVCMIQALRAARNAGFAVRTSVIDKAIGYIRASQNKDGSVRYSLRNQRPGSFELTAAGCATLAYGGRYNSKEVVAARSYLWNIHENVFNDSNLSYPYYGYFYALQALWFDYESNRWDIWFPKFVNWYWEQWDNQSRTYSHVPNGRHKEMEYGIEYRTALATLSLQIPNQFLPIFAK
ncbi:MAG: hypothetical protein ACI97A_002274 [Planctomycetota bacterium]|jgi:hypothetical protein